jgi:hypothetical protein
MKDVLEEAGITVDKNNKQKVDRVIHEMVDVAYKNCSPTWKEVKERIKTDEAARSRFVAELKQRLEAVR